MGSRGFVPVALAALSILVTGQANAGKLTVVQKAGPSDNAGRAGSYQSKTSREGCNYWVYVPKSYSAENPAGIHLYFHGQNGQGGANWFGQWSKDFLEPQNLIGINMQYEDGDNLKDPEGKMLAAEEALAQVRADYHIMPGRGVVASFSGGGIPHGLMLARYGKSRLAEWPFVHCAAYDSNFRENARGAATMSWFVGLGGKEWTIGGAGLGASQTGLMTALLGDALKGNSPDLYLRIEAEKGHSISAADVAASAAQFHRSDLAFAPFIWQPDYPEVELKPIAEQMNQLLLGKAAASLTTLKSHKGLAPEILAKADKLQEKLDARVAAVMELMKQIAQDDPVLLAYYSRIFERQLAGHEKAKELSDVISAAKKQKGYRETLDTFESFAQRHGKLLSPGEPKLQPQAAQWLTPISSGAPENSLLKKMATEYLTLK